VGGALLAEIAPITGPMYQLFVFFMVTDPRTTVSTRRGRMIVVAIVALVETLIRLAGDYQIALLRPFYVSPPILALAMVGPVALFLDLRRTVRCSVLRDEKRSRPYFRADLRDSVGIPACGAPFGSLPAPGRILRTQQTLLYRAVPRDFPPFLQFCLQPQILFLSLVLSAGTASVIHRLMRPLHASRKLIRG